MNTRRGAGVGGVSGAGRAGVDMRGGLAGEGGVGEVGGL